MTAASKLTGTVTSQLDLKNLIDFIMRGYIRLCRGVFINKVPVYIC